jgi:hypothetical protein
MQHKAVQFEVVPTTNPCCWKWIVFVNATRMRTGIALTRADAILDAEIAIERALEVSRRVRGLDRYDGGPLICSG